MLFILFVVLKTILIYFTYFGVYLLFFYRILLFSKFLFNIQ